MKYDEVVMGRRSIRGFKPKPVPREMIEEVSELATRAPSSMNTQPWHLHVITGEPLDRIRAGNTDATSPKCPRPAKAAARGSTRASIGGVRWRKWPPSSASTRAEYRAPRLRKSAATLHVV